MKTCSHVIIIVFFCFFLLTPRSVFAGSSVVINEFFVDSGQWVEVYNTGEDSVDIGGWYIDDNGGSEKYTIPQGTVLLGEEFKVFESSYFNLNKSSADKIKLLNGDSVVDSYSYTNGPGAGNSYGRDTDGSGQFVAFSTTTKGSSNNASTPLPTVTPTPEKQPTPTRIPTPTKTPTPKKEPTPTKSTAGKTSPVNSGNDDGDTPISTTKSSLTGDEKVLKISGVPTSILGIATKSATPKLSQRDSVKQQQKVLEENAVEFPIIIMLAGAVFCIACGILIFLQKRKKMQE